MAFIHSPEYTPISSTLPFSTVLEWPPCSALSYPMFSHLEDETAALPVCMPEGIRLVKKGLEVTVLCCRASISKGTRFGPYHGRMVHPSQIKEGEDNKFLWEVSYGKFLLRMLL